MKFHSMISKFHVVNFKHKTEVGCRLAHLTYYIDSWVTFDSVFWKWKASIYEHFSENAKINYFLIHLTQAPCV